MAALISTTSPPGTTCWIFNRQNHRDPNSPYLRTRSIPTRSILASAQPVKVSDGGEVVTADIHVKAGLATSNGERCASSGPGRPLPGNVFVTSPGGRRRESGLAKRWGTDYTNSTLLDGVGYTISAWTYAKIPRSASSAPPSPGTPPADARPISIASAGLGPPGCISCGKRSASGRKPTVRRR